MKIAFENHSGSTKFMSLANAIEHAISEGHFAEGDELPSVNTLSKEFNLSKDTVFKAYHVLKSKDIVDSAPTIGYFVKGSAIRILLFLDAYSPFKEELYNAFKKNLPANAIVDLAFHHYNYNIFETVINNSLNRYNFFVVMNFDDKAIAKPLKLINPDKLLILDWGEYKNENYSFVCQDFEDQAYKTLTQLKDRFKKYHIINYYYPAGSVHPQSTFVTFQQFCQDHQFQFNLIDSLDGFAIRPHEAFLVFRQKDVVELIKKIKPTGYKLGEDIGLVAYNDMPVYEILSDGITCISTDFKKMGERAAFFITNRQPIKEIIPTESIIRNSL